MTHDQHAELFEAQLSAAIDHLTAAGVNCDGNVERVSDERDPSHESRVDLVLRLRGYSPRCDLAEALAKALIAVCGEDAGLMLENTRRELRAKETETASSPQRASTPGREANRGGSDTRPAAGFESEAA